jgi:hypothetical protein
MNMELAPDAIAHWAAVMALDNEAVVGAVVSAGEWPLPKAWLALMQGEARGLHSPVGEALAMASGTPDRYQVIELTALRAMVALSGDSLGEAVTLARRASFMARTEALPRAELLANLVLARVRRHSGKPYLATRILDALARSTTESAQGWLDWERVLAGGARADGILSGGTTLGSRAAQAARQVLLAAQGGRRTEFDAEARELMRLTAGFRDIHDEAEALVALLDPDGAPPQSMIDFKRGHDAKMRYGLFGAGVFSADEEPTLAVFAVARPGAPGARILRDGLGLFGRCRMLSPEDRHRSAATGARETSKRVTPASWGPRRTHGRTDAGLAVLTLAGPAQVAEDDFWRRVYGFAYSHAAHRGVLDVLLHRMRARLDDAGTIVRAGGSLSLDLNDAIAVADPLCSPPAAARILSALARQPLATADSIAGRLGITVRAAQMALHDLVSDGACVVRRSGRQVQYQLEDSAFSEPTHRDAARPAG